MSRQLMVFSSPLRLRSTIVMFPMTEAPFSSGAV